jgi:regulation of enolase protein 1 (concanavalin A-like superfamily)
MQWLNEPPRWSENEGVLTVETGDRTDFWRETHYGFIRDDGHLRYQEVEGDFTATVRFSGAYEALYDQAGLMVRLDERNWIKAGVEYTDGRPYLSVVVTRGFSDWSVTPVEGDPEEIRLRLSRHGDAIRVETSPDGASWRMLRLAYLEPDRKAMVGPMCCSPQRAGFVATFHQFEVGPAIAKELHTA